MKQKILALIMLMIYGGNSLSLAQENETMSFMAGAARVNITPSPDAFVPYTFQVLSSRL